MTNCEPLNLSSYQIKEFSEEEKIAHSFLLNADTLKNYGLMNGKMGIVIWLLKQNKKHPNRLYENFAFELLESIDTAVNTAISTIPLGFRHGLCGIGWGMEYLIRERLIKVEDDICSSYDQPLFGALINNKFKGLDLTNGIPGILAYLLSRIESSCLSPDSLDFFTNKRFIIYAVDYLKKDVSEDSLSVLLEETNNTNFSEPAHLLLSEWEYPTLLWTLGRILHHKILSTEITDLLIACLKPLMDKKNCPENPKNIRILKYAIDSLPPTVTSLTEKIKRNINL